MQQLLKTKPSASADDNASDQPQGGTGEIDVESRWAEIIHLAWRPAWSIRSRRGALAPMLDKIRQWRRQGA